MQNNRSFNISQVPSIFQLIGGSFEPFLQQNLYGQADISALVHPTDTIGFSSESTIGFDHTIQDTPTPHNLVQAHDNDDLLSATSPITQYNDAILSATSADTFMRVSDDAFNAPVNISTVIDNPLSATSEDVQEISHPKPDYTVMYHVVLDCDFGNRATLGTNKYSPVILGKMRQDTNMTDRIPVLFELEDAIKIASRLVDTAVSTGCLGTDGNKKYPVPKRLPRIL